MCKSVSTLNLWFIGVSLALKGSACGSVKLFWTSLGSSLVSTLLIPLPPTAFFGICRVCVAANEMALDASRSDSDSEELESQWQGAKVLS